MSQPGQNPGISPVAPVATRLRSGGPPTTVMNSTAISQEVVQPHTDASRISYSQAVLSPPSATTPAFTTWRSEFPEFQKLI